jgi:predicted SAM-dependent methyltransferase
MRAKAWVGLVAASEKGPALADDSTFPDWNWDDPSSLADRMVRLHEDLARCETLEPTGIVAPYTKGQLVDIGVTGIEFAAWKTAHPSGLSTDAIPLRGAAAGGAGASGARAGGARAGAESASSPAVTQRGRLFRVDRERYFVELDVGEPLPFESGCVDWVYAEHLIEHISVPVAIGWLREVRRILAPGGLLRLTTPDLRRYVESYLTGDPFFATHRHGVHAAGLGPPMPARDAFMVNQIFYFYGHRWIYDLGELRYVLTEAGFDAAAVRQRGFRDGARADVAELDRAVRQDETIYVEVTA